MGNAPLRRVGVLGDLHGRHRALDAALTFFRAEGVDAVLSVGDLVDGAGDVEAVIATLRGAGVYTVRGNHERWLLSDAMRSLPHATERRGLRDDTLEWISALRPVQRLETVAGALLLGHGLGSQDMVCVTDDEPRRVDPSDPVMVRFAGESAGCRFAVGGHTHRRMVRELCGVTMINAGTLVESDDPCVAVIDFEERAAWHHDLVGGRVVPSPWQRVAL